ncbi:unnamed protein product [Durusdinium trenchii]|uniref:Feruloyl esterase n=1 Tax=Durusdinium trenchii TaxID=1381693 RepID=A0ABP0L3U2_9DINO
MRHMLAALTCFLRHTNALEISVEDISHRKSQGQNCAVQNFVHIIYLYILILIYFQSKIISMFIYISRGRHQHVVICTNANVPELLEILLTKSAAEFAEEGSWSKELGFVFGHLHYNFLNALTEKINELSSEFNAERIIAMGYSMGGFGAIQLGCFAPELFDAVVSVAGYGMGTSEPNSGYGAPQPVSGEIFDLFLEREACKLARVPVVLAVHAPSDMCSSFRDVSAIIQKTQETAWDTWERSTAKLVRVPDGMANSDHPGKKRKSNHGYFNCTLLHNGSEKMLWRELRRLVDRAPQRGGDSMDWEPERGWGRSRRWSRMYEDPPNSRSWGWCPT